MTRNKTDIHFSNMIKIRTLIFTVTALLLSLTEGNAYDGKTDGRFYNLTAGEVAIDSMLPHFTVSFPLNENYTDSIYNLEVVYPEYMDLSKEDIRKLKMFPDFIPGETPDIDTWTVVDRRRGSLEASMVPIVKRGGKYQFLVSFMLRLKSSPKINGGLRKAKAADNSPASRYADHSILASGRWAKISGPTDGVYNLTSDVVRQAGFSDLSKVRIFGYGGHLQNETLVGDELAQLDDLMEVPTCSIAGKRLFYGKGTVSWSSPTETVRTRNPYSNSGCYFITDIEATESNGLTESPLTVDSAEFVNSFYPSPAFYHSLHEIDNYAWYQGGRNLFEDSPIYSGGKKTYTIPNRLASRHDAASRKIYVAVTAGVASTVSININGNEYGLMGISVGNYDNGNKTERTFSINDDVATDSITISCTNGGPLRLDYISVTYPEIAEEPKLTAGTFPQPDFVYGIMNQDLHSHGFADMVIIIPTSQKLLSQAQRLADYHEQHDGMRVRIVPADELYNEFSSGTPDANAYRRYLKMLYDRAETEADMPKYLLLFGDCVWDNRMLTASCRQFNADDYLLAFESENSFSHVYCYIDDGFFTLLDDGEGSDPLCSDKLDVAVGRFPVTDPSEAQIMVDKAINYMDKKYAGEWLNTVMFLGDDGDNDMHMRDVNQAADATITKYPGYIVKKVMWDAYKRETSSTGNTYPEVESIVKQQQADGALVIDYAGHGMETQMSHENVLRLSDFQSFTNENLPLWVTASCDIMPFDGTKATIGEAAVLNKKGGAVAFYGTTRTVFASQNTPLNVSFMKHVLTVEDGKPIGIGEAQRRTKNEMIIAGYDRTQNKLQYSLLGDPAMPLNLPTMSVVIDSINGVAMADGNTPQLKAGAVVELKGHIEDNQGVMASDFNGKVSVTVRDTEETIVCRQNEPSTSLGFQFTDRQKILYNGSDSIRSGEFKMFFAVPRDINYSDGSGLVNAFAINSDKTLIAHGAEDRFFVNGTEAIDNDSIGPSLYCYLNTPSFVNGGDVNTTPFFVAEITDKDGINASGNGIGHDLQLVIDGEMSMTYNLNNYFSYDFGSYTKGTVCYSIPELSEGLHKLKFRAWDILNNSSTTELSFNVVKGLSLDILSIACTDNPASTSTTFVINHNFTGSMVDVIIDVFDMSGRLLWSHSESGPSKRTTYTVDWDLTVDNGRRLETGVYLYRVRIGGSGGAKVSKAKKLVIVGNK